MSPTFTIALSFIAFLLLFTGVGVYSATRKQNTTEDYLLASRDVNPWITGLSAFATAHSGAMFISTIGWTYAIGISAAWALVGWCLGDYLAWFVVHKRLRIVSEETNSETIGTFLAGGDRNGEPASRPIAIVSGIVTIAFLGGYAAAQLLAGSKALHAIFGWDYNVGIILGAIIVVAYCFSGGIRASIWTDALQSVVMFFAMLSMVLVTLTACGGFSGLWQQLEAIDPALIDPVPQNLSYGFAFFLLGWLIAGVGAIGQPHIMVRAMVVDDAENMTLTRNTYVIAYAVFSFAATIVGLAARVLMPGLLDGSDPELALPQMALAMMPSLAVGMILAGIFAAVVSTADSQILSCSAALTQDLFPKMSHSYKLSKMGTLLVTAIVLAIALASNKNVFFLVRLSWGALAAGLGPLLALRAWKQPVSTNVGVTMMVVGVGMTVAWNVLLQQSDSVYEALPGMLSASIVYGVARLLSPSPSNATGE